jgi:hypothetical protein
MFTTLKKLRDLRLKCQEKSLIEQFEAEVLSPETNQAECEGLFIEPEMLLFLRHLVQLYPDFFLDFMH